MKTFAKSVVLAVVALAAAAVGGAGRASDPAAPARVEWEGHVVPGFKRAIAEKKLMVVYFRKDYCELSKGPCRHCTPIDAVLTGKAVGELADKAVWVWQSIGTDDAKGNVAKMRKELNVDGVPAVVVLEVSPEELREVGRVVGSRVTEAEMVRRLRQLLEPRPIVPAGSTPAGGMR